MNHLLEIAVQSGLKFPIINIDASNEVPDNTFGVFIGIERSDKHTLSSWPTNVHGCIGYWDPNYQTMDKKKVVQKMIAVSYDATWNDDRKNYFKHSLYVDLYAKYKIYFMLKPIDKINIESGMLETENILFNNDDYGIIVEENKSHRATYLPHVFSGRDWLFIKKSLMSKADINNINNIIFYAYQCEIRSMTLADYFINPIKNFINKSYKSFIPYSISNDIVVVDKTEYVRNLATIYDILQLDMFGYELNDTVKDEIINNLHYYQEKYLKDKQAMRQASSFLMLDLYMFNSNDPFINVIKEDLYEQLEKISDKDFELGEILMGLLIVDGNNDILRRELDNIPIYDAEQPLDEKAIFRYNWHSKLVENINDENYTHDLTTKIFDYIEKYVYKNETNYYAVEFESLATLYKAGNDISNESKIEGFIESFLIILQKRRNQDGLYKFNNGVARLDITGHILNGLFSLISASK